MGEQAGPHFCKAKVRPTTLASRHSSAVLWTNFGLEKSPVCSQPTALWASTEGSATFTG